MSESTDLRVIADSLVAKAEAVREATKRDPVNVEELLDLSVEFADLLERIARFALAGVLNTAVARINNPDPLK